MPHRVYSIGYNCDNAAPVGVVDVASSGDLADVLREVNRLRVQLERCISSNDRLRHTLRKCGSVPTLPDDSFIMSAHQPHGKLLLYVCRL